MKKPSQGASVHIRAKARPANAVRVNLLKHQQVCRRRLVDLARFRKNHILRKIGNNDMRLLGRKQPLRPDPADVAIHRIASDPRLRARGRRAGSSISRTFVDLHRFQIRREQGTARICEERWIGRIPGSVYEAACDPAFDGFAVPIGYQSVIVVPGINDPSQRQLL